MNEKIDLFQGDARIEVDGTVSILKEPEKYYSLEFLQEQVGGYIEEVWCPFSNRHIGIVNEEGLVIGMEYNERASILFNMRLVGPVLVVSTSKMEKGDEEDEDEDDLTEDDEEYE